MSFNLNDSYNGTVTKPDTKSETVTGTKTYKSNKAKLKINGGYVTLVDNYEPSDDPCDFCIHKKAFDGTISTGTISNLGTFSQSVDICSTCKHNKNKKNNTPSIPTYPSPYYEFGKPYVGDSPSWPNVIYSSYSGNINSTDSNTVKSYSDK